MPVTAQQCLYSLHYLPVKRPSQTDHLAEELLVVLQLVPKGILPVFLCVLALPVELVRKLEPRSGVTDCTMLTRSEGKPPSPLLGDPFAVGT